MSDQGNEGYEAPLIEQIDTKDDPSVTEAGILTDTDTN
jgi:hypothetical protein